MKIAIALACLLTVGLVVGLSTPAEGGVFVSVGVPVYPPPFYPPPVPVVRPFPVAGPVPIVAPAPALPIVVARPFGPYGPWGYPGFYRHRHWRRW